MSNDLETRPEVRVTELVNDIITDVQVLITQQLALFRHEIKGEIGRAREAGSLVVVGLGIVVMGCLLLCGMLVHLLAQIAPDLPLWACYGIVGAPIAALGGILCLLGIQRFGYFNRGTVELAHDLKEKVDG
ncbi:MAG: phage holin family protein [Candidatus Hydrogenedentes bacterium]|nr:phage holin family protein [Candidatus Hydrogenedentota bacterium]